VPKLTRFEHVFYIASIGAGVLVGFAIDLDADSDFVWPATNQLCDLRDIGISISVRGFGAGTSGQADNTYG
jgi:hypothetical protein